MNDVKSWKLDKTLSNVFEFCIRCYDNYETEPVAGYPVGNHVRRCAARLLPLSKMTFFRENVSVSYIFTSRPVDFGPFRMRERGDLNAQTWFQNDTRAHTVPVVFGIA